MGKKQEQKETVTEIPLAKIRDFPEHPYQVRDDESMFELVESIKERGLIQPVLVRPVDDGYEMVSGHHKTEKQCYVSGINCVPKRARKEMMKTKERADKLDGILAFHAYQSFAPGEVTPAVAHEIGKKLAEKMWGDKYEVIVATHIDREHIHSHFVINSVSFVDGKKYNACLK